MSVPTFTMRQLIEAGAHFGHHTRRWNPKMKKYIFGVRQGIHILDLQQTVPMFYKALEAMRETAANGGKILFVATKRQAQEIVAAAAARCGQHYVNSNWLGGTLTNWKTVSQSVKRLKETEERIEKGDFEGLTKKERLTLDRKKDKLSKSLGGIKNMNGRPDLMFVIDIVKERLAIDEANCLGIPVVAICDSNADPMLVNFPVPANDDASKAIALYCDLAVGAVLDGMAAELKAAGVDVDAKPDEDVVDKGE